MEHSFLIVNSLYKIGAQIGGCISGVNIDVELYDGSLDEVFVKLGKKKYSGLVIFMMLIKESDIEYIAKIHRRYEDLKIYPLVFTGSEYIRQGLIQAGASFCFIMPYMPNELSSIILCDFYNDRSYKEFPQIVAYLKYRGFDSRLRGFYPLCCAINMLVENPDRLNGSITDFYQEIAEFINSKYENVERNLRTVISRVFRKGIEIDNNKLLFRMKNRELLLMLTEEFKKEYPRE